MTRRRQPRRGVLLLIVLSLLVLFILIGTTFIVVADQYAGVARTYQKMDTKGDDPSEILDAALMDLLRGSRDRQSPFFNESLLSDLYGNDGFRGQIAKTISNQKYQQIGPLLTIPFLMDANGLPIVDTSNLSQQQLMVLQTELRTAFAEKFDAYSGSLFTMTEGPLRGRSYRIVRFNAPADLIGPIEKRIGELTIELDVPNFNRNFLRDVRFVVNGRPFNGTGAGFNPETGQLDNVAVEFKKEIENQGAALNVEFNLALLPNYRFRLDPEGPGPPVIYPPDYDQYVGGSDESYDVADYQNLFLGVPPSPFNNAPNLVTDQRLEKIGIPTLHRPFLINFWLHKLETDGLLDYWSATKDTAPVLFAGQFRRSLVFRPLPMDHPNFTGSNPAFSHPGYVMNGSVPQQPLQLLPHPLWNQDGDNVPDCMDPDIFDTSGDPGPDQKIDDLDDGTGNGVADMALTSGPWDVDNDNDTIPDSIWVDLGYPVQTTIDGRQYKPLFAILCVDLDGRINVNAHGMDHHQNSIYNTAIDTSTAANGAPATFAPSTVLGQGYGPPEVNLFEVLNSGVTNANPAVAADNLILARSQGRLDRIAGTQLSANETWQPGNQLLVPNQEPENFMQETGYPIDYRDPSVLTNFASAPDLKGRRFVYLDALGQPLTVDAYDDLNTDVNGQSGWLGETSNDPYEVDLLHPTNSDSLYSVSELETLYRAFDRDASRLPRRLYSYLQLSNDLYGRHFTSHSFDIPIAGSIPGNISQREEMQEAYDENGEEKKLIFAGRDEDGQPTEKPIFLGQSIPELFAKRLRANMPTDDNLPAERWIREQLDVMLAPEIRRGQKLNLNRLFGNAIDNNNAGTNGAGVVDDPTEGFVESIPNVYSSSGAGYADQFVIDYPTEFGSFGGTAKQSSKNAQRDYSPSAMHIPAERSPVKFSPAKQVFARHLYCLLQLLVDEGWEIPPLLKSDGSPQDLPSPRRLRAHTLAQWAINVADFRDPDAIMTPFEYDIDPFDGWNVDGNLVTDEGNFRGVVWGAERPELVISETFALHNRRVRDMATDTPDGVDTNSDHKRMTGQMDMEQENDPHLDQYRIPQGSLYVELFCPRAPYPIAAQGAEKYPLELYSLHENQWKLDLGRMAPPIKDDDNEVQNPVWRLAIATHEWGAEDGQRVPQTMTRYALDNRQTVTFNPRNMNIDPTKTDNFNVERYVWFKSNLNPKELHANTLLKERIYWHNGTNHYVKAGGYAVVGPRAQTEISAHDNDGTPGVQQIRMRPDGISVGANSYECTCIVAGRPAPWLAPGAEPNEIHDWVGMSVSEPLGTLYYPQPDQPDGKYDIPLDEPLDGRAVYRDHNGLYDAGVYVGIEEDAQKPDTGLGVGIGVGTIRNHKTVLLQRLADPTRRHHETYNPYITVDIMPVDLSIYNGEYSISKSKGEVREDWNPDAPALMGKLFDGQVHEPLVNNGGGNPNQDPDHMRFDLTFSSRERIGTESSAAGGNEDLTNLWAMNFLDRRTLVERGGGAIGAMFANDRFEEPVIQGLGFLNYNFGEVQARGRLNATGIQPEYKTAPVRPFPWITWNNRPFVSHYELLQVPALSASRMLFEFSTQLEKKGNQDGKIENPYESDVDDDKKYLQYRGYFGHLLNFLQASNQQNDAANLARFLEYVEVPSRFVGTQVFHNPAVLNHQNLNTIEHADKLDFSSPFNSISRFRDPGKGNINTIPNRLVWSGFYPSALDPSGQLWQDVFDSRMGKIDGGSMNISQLPSLFSNPFRSSSSADLVPRDVQIPREPVQATLLRSNPEEPEKPLFSSEFAGQAFRDPERNSYFHYQNVQRLGNLLTTHSNVYAVWITVGYFEVLPWNPQNPFDPTLPAVQDAAHPDGFQLGKELGSDSGEIQRHRAFYIIDRSIPVGFWRGENLNVKDAILLKRFIE